MAPQTVELLYFDGCPNIDAARRLVERVAVEEHLDIELRLVDVVADDVERVRFLGSPSVRVGGHDVEPGADERETFLFGCRVYRTNAGFSGTPSEEWVRTALTAHAR